ncbi:hypothetical protein AHOG_20690 [Actinoalloteichus hoggarensis]|uniref:Uncharacterized protein n=1 Tax=Actinoalloteichus hoggarensis TaxID=1470176 RepID=A0A221W7A4_9PSEU|nr:hypothetical protein AHOG_20690 [Actinoalloteichus hoggarensis]
MTGPGAVGTPSARHGAGRDPRGTVRSAPPSPPARVPAAGFPSSRRPVPCLRRRRARRPRRSRRERWPWRGRARRCARRCGGPSGGNPAGRSLAAPGSCGRSGRRRPVRHGRERRTPRPRCGRRPARRTPGRPRTVVVPRRRRSGRGCERTSLVAERARDGCQLRRVVLPMRDVELPWRYAPALILRTDAAGIPQAVRERLGSGSPARPRRSPPRRSRRPSRSGGSAHRARPAGSVSASR